MVRADIACMARDHPRPRRQIAANRVWLLKALGFHYSHWRGEYVLRVIGDHFGPVYRVRYRAKAVGVPERRPGHDVIA